MDDFWNGIAVLGVIHGWLKQVPPRKLAKTIMHRRPSRDGSGNGDAVDAVARHLRDVFHPQVLRRKSLGRPSRGVDA